MTPFFLDHPSIGFTAAGELTLAGRTASSLLAEFGSPLVVLLEDVIRANCRRYKSRLATYPRSRIYYASKAFLTTGFCRLLIQEGLGLDVVSAGELRTALSAGFPPGDILLHGNAKTEAELRLAVEAGVGRIAVDNWEDIARLGRIINDTRGGGTLPPSARAGAGPAPTHESLRRQGAAATGEVLVQLRIAPGIRPETHEKVQTGQVDSKFGFNLPASGADLQVGPGGPGGPPHYDALAAAQRIVDTPGLALVGLHCHIGSQIMDDAMFTAAARVMLELYARIQRETGAPLSELNLGGGIGIRYQPGDHPPAIEAHLARLTSALTQISAELGIDPPVLCDEPGRSIVGEAGVTLYTVQSVKRIPGVRNYAGLDGGMTDNPRYALYGARHYAMRANDAPEARGEMGDELWSLSGKCCETGDMLIKDAPMPELAAGDIVAMFSTGAYTYSMASNYNRVGKPAVVLAGEHGVALLARREEPEELARLDEVPEWLKASG